MFDADLNCPCDVCKCTCTALYYRDHSAKLALQSQKEREDKMVGENQTKLAIFINFKYDVIDITKMNMKSMEGYKDTDDIIAKSVIDITKNTDL